MNHNSLMQARSRLLGPSIDYVILARRPNPNGNVAMKLPRKIEPLTPLSKPSCGQRIGAFFKRIIRSIKPLKGAQVEAAKLKRTDELNRHTVHFLADLQKNSVTPDSFQKLINISHRVAKRNDIRSVVPFTSIMTAFQNQWVDEEAEDYQSRVESILSALASPQSTGYLAETGPSNSQMQLLLQKMVRHAVQRFVEDEPEENRYSEDTRQRCNAHVETLRTIAPELVSAAEAAAMKTEKYRLGKSQQEEPFVLIERPQRRNPPAEPESIRDDESDAGSNRKAGYGRARKQNHTVNKRETDRSAKERRQLPSVSNKAELEIPEKANQHPDLIDAEKNRVLIKRMQNFLTQLSSGQDHIKSFVKLMAMVQKEAAPITLENAPELGSYDEMIVEQLRQYGELGQNSEIRSQSESESYYDANDDWADDNTVVGKTSHSGAWAGATGMIDQSENTNDKQGFDVEIISAVYGLHLNEQFDVSRPLSGTGQKAYDNPAAAFLRPGTEKVQQHSSQRLQENLKMLSSKPVIDVLNSTDEYRQSARRVLYAMAEALEDAIHNARQLELNADEKKQLEKLDQALKNTVF